MDPWYFAALAAVSFFGATVQAATGFGFAILTVPFFLLIMDSLAAIQIAAVTNLALSLALAPWLFRDAPRRLLLNLVVGSAVGFPIGLAAFRAAELDTVKLVAGGLITAFALWISWREWRAQTVAVETPQAETANFDSRPLPELGVGLASGVMAAALAMPGPAVVLYLAARRPGKRISRAITLTLFGFSYGTVCVMHTLWGGMGQDTWLLALALVPFVLVGAGAGHVAARFLSEEKFRTVVLVILVAFGLYAIWTALSS
jgi:uncharacterized membrane protein YfcA